MSATKATHPPRLSHDLVPWLSAVAVIICALLLDSSLPGLWFLPWAFGLLFFGLPHGACDHLVASRLTGRRSAGDAVVFVALYLGAASAVFALWMLDPALALFSFLALTAWHWGSADATPREVRGFARFSLAAAARGALVISAPIAFHPEPSLSAFAGILSVFGESPAWNQEWIATTAGACLVLSVIAGTVMISSSLVRRRALRALREAVEMLLLVALFFFVSPIVAVGVYFVFWHAWRHVLRVSELLEDPDAPRKAGLASGLASAVVAYHAKALPLTLVSLALLLILPLAFGLGEPRQLLGIYIVLLSALTAPHAAIILFWDLREDALLRRRNPKAET